MHSVLITQESLKRHRVLKQSKHESYYMVVMEIILKTFHNEIYRIFSSLKKKNSFISMQGYKATTHRQE